MSWIAQGSDNLACSNMIQFKKASESFAQPGSVRAQIAALKADPAFREAWLEHSHPGHQQAVARMAALTEKLEVLS